MKRQTLIADRYGRAFFQVADEQKALDKVEVDFSKVQSLLEDDASLTEALKNPLISASELTAFLKDLSKKLNFDDLTQRFLLILAENRRGAYLAEVMEVFKKMLLQHRNQLVVDVNSNAPIKKDTQEKIRKILGQKTGKDIILNLGVQDDLLGGIVIKYDSYTLDFSLKSKLAELKHELERLA